MPIRSKLPKAAVRRAIYSLIAVALAEIIGTVGFYLIEGVRWVDAFYFESMLATGQGPPFVLNTDTGKIFASIMGFVSVGSVLSAVIFTVGPLVVRFWREGIEAVEEEARKLEQGAAHGIRNLEADLTRRKGP